MSGSDQISTRLFEFIGRQCDQHLGEDPAARQNRGRDDGLCRSSAHQIPLQLPPLTSANPPRLHVPVENRLPHHRHPPPPE